MILLKTSFWTRRKQFWRILTKFYDQTNRCFFPGKPFTLQRFLWTRRMQLWQPCLNFFSLKILKKFAKTTLPNILFWKLPGTFSLKRSSGHENHFWQPGRTCPPNPETFSPKSKKNYIKLDLPRKTVLLKWSSEHVEVSIEISADFFRPKLWKLAALSPKIKANL